MAETLLAPCRLTTLLSTYKDPEMFAGEQVWCPYCKGYFRLLRVHGAAKLADVNRRTIYRYIEEGSVYTIKIAGKTYRLCSGCLLKKDEIE